jgi:hypothetical protein
MSARVKRLGHGLSGLVLLTVSVWLAGCGDEASTPPRPVTPTVAPAVTPVNSNQGFALHGGGCYPDGANPGEFDLLNLVDPEWAPVVNGQTVDSDPVLIHGVAVKVHGDTGGDFPATHVRSDQNTSIHLDDADAGRLATGNVNTERSLIELEWEAGAYPAWAWAGEGDRIVALGRWIFDCGHSFASPGHCSASTTVECVLDSDCRPPTCPNCNASETCQDAVFAYQAELHPPQATAVLREGRGAVLASEPSAAPVRATRADVFISGNGGGAGDRCVLTHQANPMLLLGPRVQCYPLKEPVAPINATDFSFDVPLPPRPAGGQVKVRRVDYSPPGGVAPFVDIVTPVAETVAPGATGDVQVRVRMSEAAVSGQLPTGYAATIFAGWDSDTTSFTHVRVTVQAAVIRNALQPLVPVIPRVCAKTSAPCGTDSDCAAGDTCHGVGPVKSWRLQAGVNGEWQELDGLSAVNTGDVIPQSLVYEQYLPVDGTLRIVADGVSENCISTMFGKALFTDQSDLGIGGVIACLMSVPRNPGKVDIAYSGPTFGAGSSAMDYETAGVGGDGGACSVTTTRGCVDNGDCPTNETCVNTGGAFALRYRIEKIP